MYSLIIEVKCAIKIYLGGVTLAENAPCNRENKYEKFLVEPVAMFLSTAAVWSYMAARSGTNNRFSRLSTASFIIF